MKTEELQAIVQRIPAIPREQMSLAERDRADLLAYTEELSARLDTAQQELAEQEREKWEILKANEGLGNLLGEVLHKLRFAEGYALWTPIRKLIEELEAKAGHAGPACPQNCSSCQSAVAVVDDGRQVPWLPQSKCHGCGPPSHVAHCRDAECPMKAESGTCQKGGA